ncbi:MAG: hypothetical protein H7A25_15255 [Leptospiraceae bacterium]|nr:hypothetical protein [Leptospiraceae bacterium]
MMISEVMPSQIRLNSSQFILIGMLKSLTVYIQIHILEIKDFFKFVF